MSGDKRSARKIAYSYDFFLAETTAMPKVGKVLGKFLGPKGRMPLPITIDTPIENMINKYKTAIRIRGRTLSLSTKLGDEDMTDEQIVENAMLIINTITSKLPNSEKNLKGFIIKLSMSPPITLSAQEAI
jgi:large subunit ribosomal protein L1